MQNYTVNGIEYNWKTGLPLNQTDQDIDDIRKEEELNQYQEVVKQNNINPSGSGLSNIPPGEGNAKINGVEINPNFKKQVTTEELNKQFSDKKTKKKYNVGTINSNKKIKINSRGGLLRYPLEAMTDTTDYLQIDIKEYTSIGKRSEELGSRTIVSIPGSRQLPKRSGVPGGLTTQSLVNKGTILLQIPANLQDGNSVSYGDSKMNSIVAAAVGGASDMMTDVGKALGEGDFEGAGQIAKDIAQATLTDSNIGPNAKKLVTRKLASMAVSALGGNVTINQLLAREDGQIFNPNMELLFNGPTLRNFRFSFKMTPRSKNEAEQCKLIIRTFKMNMSPKVVSGPNLFLNTPNVFELRYKTGFRNHPFLHKFKQCFLTDVSVNYTGEGVYATYEDREPISMIMDLSFKELEPIYDIDYFDENGFDSDNTVGY